MYKLVVVMREDLKLSKGKACAQTGHAVLDCYLRTDDSKLLRDWLEEGGKKIVLKTKKLEDIYALNEAAKRVGLITSIIKDAGHTEVSPGTATCVGIGPDKEEKIDKVTKDLEPY